jgi:hypothetical protein
MATAGMPHALKLYYLFIKDADAYAVAGHQIQPIGQAIVKESWTPEEVKAGGDLAPSPFAGRDGERFGLAPRHDNRMDALSAFAERDGKQYRPAKQAELFIMFKVDPATNGTDSGWVYGTVTPDGTHVTSSGRVASCLQCHQNAPVDRMFANPTATPAGY